MPATADQTAASPGAPQLWRPAGAVFLAASLGALAAGANPGLWVPPDRARDLAVPPALGVMLAAQVVFVLIFCTLLIRPRRRRSLRAYVLATLGEYAVLVAAALPLYVIAAWLSDATARDVVRCLLYLSAVAAAAWGLSLWAASGRTAAMTAVGLLAAVAALGAPVGCYLLAELADSPPGVGWLTAAAPATFAFRLAGRSPELLGGPLWAWALWPAVGAVAALGRLLTPRSADRAGCARKPMSES